MDPQAIELYRRHALLMHLTDDELATHLDGGLEGLVALRVVAHLERCLLCEGRLEFLRSMSATNVIKFPTDPPTPEKASNDPVEIAAACIYTKKRSLGEALNDASFELDHVLERAAHTRGREHFEDAGGWFEWLMSERDDGTMRVSIASHVTEEAGAQVDLLCDQVPDWRRTATFELEGEEIVARIVLTLDDRRQLPRGCQLRCRLRHPDGEPSE